MRYPTSPTHVAAGTTRSRRGFTLIEILIVLVIVSTLLTLSVPRINLGRYKADGAVQVLRSTLQLAQRAALTQQHDVLVSFDTSRQEMRVVLDANNDASYTPGAGERATYRPMPDGALFKQPPIGVNGPVAASITGGTVRLVDHMPTIVFHRDGAASGNTEIYFQGKSGRAEDFRAIVLTQATGRSDWFRYNGNKWSAGGL
jgi:prepilin-type N-terminal cleavage/methylation domain-containing protein